MLTILTTRPFPFRSSACSKFKRLHLLTGTLIGVISRLESGNTRRHRDRSPAANRMLQNLVEFIPNDFVHQNSGIKLPLDSPHSFV